MIDFRKFYKIGIINTIKLNWYYFGSEGLVRPRILSGKHVRIKKLSGSMEAPDIIGCLQIGLREIDISDRKSNKSIWNNLGHIKIEGKVDLGSGTKLSNSGTLILGDNVCVTANSSIVCHKFIKIASDVLISWDTLIMDTDFHKIYERDMKLTNIEKRQINNPRKIIIGSHTWIGCRCLILKGSKIPANSIIAAQSTITKTFDKEYAIIGSNKILKKNIEWSR